MSAPAQQIEPKTALDEQIAQVVRDMLAEQGKQAAALRVNAESSFERDLGLGSLDLVELVVRCESKLEIAVPDEVAEQADTPSGWAKAILNGGEETARSLYRIVPPPMEQPAALRTSEAGTLTIVEVLAQRASLTPDRIVLHLLGQGAGSGRTAAQLLDAAEVLARGLVRRGIRPKDCVALLMQPGLAFFESFLALHLAGAVPLLLYPPSNQTQITLYSREVGANLREAAAVAIVIGGEQRALCRILHAMVPDLLGTFELRSLREEGKRTWVDLPGPEPGAPAYVQLTSGATGKPRTIAVSHQVLRANLEALGERLELRPGDAVATCLPLAGGWGLTSWLLSIHYGLPLSYVAPREFAERPDVWLWAIHNSRSTISAAPDSAYEACARRIPLWTVEGLDLSRWRCAITAGELVLPETVEAFSRRFGAFGFQREAILPSYGLAEGGVLALARPGDALVPDAQGCFAVGPVLASHDVRVAEGQVEFRTAGSKVWFATGDLGSFREGRLTITGRAKEVIRHNEVALNPVRIETAAAGVAGIAPGSVAVFAVSRSGSGRVVLAAESAAARTPAAAGVIAQLRRVIQNHGGVAIDEIVLAAPGSLPRTGDGRLRRVEAREQYRHSSLGRAPGSGAPGPAIWLTNLPGLTRLGVSSVQGRIDTSMRQWQASSAAGAAPLTASRARKILHHLGVEAAIEGELLAHTLVVVHRCGPFDPVIFAAFCRVPLRFAGASVLAGTPSWLHPCLRPLIAETENEIRHALEQGVLVQFPDNDLGESAARCRYRLTSFRAAGTIIPAVVEQRRGTVTVRFGRAAAPEAGAEATRERTRTLLGRLREASPRFDA